MNSSRILCYIHANLCFRAHRRALCRSATYLHSPPAQSRIIAQSAEAENVHGLNTVRWVLLGYLGRCRVVLWAGRMQRCIELRCCFYGKGGVTGPNVERGWFDRRALDRTPPLITQYTQLLHSSCVPVAQPTAAACHFLGGGRPAASASICFGVLGATSCSARTIVTRGFLLRRWRSATSSSTPSSRSARQPGTLQTRRWQ